MCFRVLLGEDFTTRSRYWKRYIVQWHHVTIEKFRSEIQEWWYFLFSYFYQLWLTIAITYLRVSTSLVAIPCLRWLIAVQTTFMPHFAGELSAVQQSNSINSGIIRCAVWIRSATNIPRMFFSRIYNKTCEMHTSLLSNSLQCKWYIFIPFCPDNLTYSYPLILNLYLQQPKFLILSSNIASNHVVRPRLFC